MEKSFCIETKIENMYYPCWSSTDRLDFPWQVWKIDDLSKKREHEVVSFSPTAEGRAEAYCHYLRYQRDVPPTANCAPCGLALKLRDGVGQVAIPRFYSRKRGEVVYYYQTVRANKNVSGVWYVNPIRAEHGSVIVEPEFGVPGLDEYARWFIGHTQRDIDPALWSRWARGARRGEFSTDEKMRLIAAAVKENYHEAQRKRVRCEQYALDIFETLAVEIHIIRGALGNVIAADLVNSGWWSD